MSGAGPSYPPPPHQPGQYPYPPAGGHYPQGYPPPQRTSGMAVTSLVLGLILCVPFLTGLLAAIFGLVGIRATRDPQVKGRGMAVAGLILGLLNCVGFAALIGVLIVGSREERAVARQFVQDLGAGNVDAAMAATSGPLPRDQVQQLSDTVVGYGVVQDVTTTGVYMQAGQTVISGFVTLPGGPKVFTITMVDVDGTPKVVSAQFGP